MDRVMTKNNNRMKTLEERLHDAEDQAIQASRRVRFLRFESFFNFDMFVRLLNN